MATRSSPGAATPTSSGTATPTSSGPATQSSPGTATPSSLGTSAPTSSGTATPTSSEAAIPTSPGTATPSSSGAATRSSSGTATQTSSGEATRSSPGTATPSSLGTSAPTSSGTATPTSPATATPSSLGTSAPTSSGTATPTSSGAATPTSPRTATPSSSGAATRSSPGTATPRSSGAATPSSPGMATPTSSGAATRSSPGTATPSSPETATPSSSGAATPSSSGRAIPSSSGAATPSSSGAATPSSSGMATPTSSGTATPSSLGTATPNSSGTATPSSSGTATPSSLGGTTSSSASGPSRPNQGTTISHAPAGQTYRGVEHAGECTLEVNAGCYPDTSNSYMIPPMFINEYPEPINESTGDIRKRKGTFTQKEENQYIGVNINARAEEAEYRAFRAFERLVSKDKKNPLLVLRNYELTTNPSQDFRTSVLESELGINFGKLHTRGEFDAVVAVKDVGLVLCEIKTRFNEQQQDKAEKQLQHGKLFFQHIMSHITNQTFDFPIVKVIIFPGESTPSPSTKSLLDSYVLHKDILEDFSNFTQKWTEIVNELHSLKVNNSFSSDDFRRFVRIATGVWCMQPYQKQHYQYNNNEASSSYMLQQNDDMVNRQIFTSDVNKAKDKSQIPPPVADVELCRPSEGFPECKGLEVIYLTPEQKHFYQKFPHAILRGPAGSGKTILFYLKMVDILQNHSNKNMLIIAPPTHTSRFEQFLKFNGAHPIISETFPPPVSGGVVIMELKDFFKVSSDTLKSYDVSDYHLFMDDFHNLRLSSSYTFDDVVNFIEHTHANSDANLTLWCAVDVGQSVVADVNDNDNATKLFFTNSSTERSLKIPVYVLHSVLRNSVEISTAVKEVRDRRIAKKKLSSVVLSNFDTGHRIRTQSGTYHKLKKWTGSTGYKSEDWENHASAFVVDRLKEELNSLFDVQKTLMKLNEIAVLFDDLLRGAVEQAIVDMLLNTFNIIPQTIEQSITTNNNTIIMDSYDSVASFECACVVYLCGDNSAGDCEHYNAMSRARTKLVVVDIDCDQKPPLLTDDDVIMSTWEERDGGFQKL